MSRAFENRQENQPDVLSYSEALRPNITPDGQAYAVWLVSLFFVLFQFLIQLSSGEILDGLMRSFSLTALGGSILASAYYYIYVALQTPAGVLTDRYGPRLLLSSGAFVLMSGCLIFGLAHHVVLAFCGRLLMGFGAAFAFVGSLNLLTKWFPRERFTIMTGITETCGMGGTLVGSLLLAHLIEEIGWRDCMVGAGIISAVIGVLVVTVVRDRPANKIKKKHVKRRILPGLRVLLRMRVAWINGVYSGIMFSVVTVFAALWGIPFFQAVYDFTLFKATVVCSMMYIGVGVSCPMIGFIDRFIPQRRFFLMGAAFTCAVLLCILLYVSMLPFGVLLILMVLLGITAGSYVLTFAIANEIAATRIKTASIGFVNTLSVGFAPILQTLIGLILFLLTMGVEHNGVHLYSVHEYHIALSVEPILLLIACGLAWFLPNRR